MTKISPGDRFGHWTVLAPSKERPYGEYLDQNAGWEEDLKEAIEKLKKNKSPPLCLQSTPRGTQGFGKAGMPLPRLKTAQKIKYSVLF